MIKRTIYSLFIIITIQLKAQPTFDYAYHTLASEEPLGFIKYNTFSILFSRTVYSTGSYDLRALGLNNNKSIRFNVLIPQNVSLSKQPVFNTGILALCKSTPDKGMLEVNRSQYCQPPSSFYPVYFCTRIDSTGSVVFSIPINAMSFVSAGVINNNYYYLTSDQNLYRINPLNGNITTTLHVASSNISCSTINSKKQIIFGTSDSLSVIDTTGSVLLNSATSYSYSLIKVYKKNYYLLNSTKTILDQRDSMLNILASLTVGSNRSISDYSIYNDSVVVAIYDSNLDKSIVSVFNSSLTALASYTINITQHKIIGINKDSCYTFFSSERAGILKALSGYGSYNQSSIYNSGLSSFSSLNNINYPNDIVLKTIKTQSFIVTSSNIAFGWNYSFYNYQHSLILYNNSSDTIKSFHVCHPQYQNLPFSHCDHPPQSAVYDADYILTVNPHDSVELQMPAFSGVKSFSSPSNTVTIDFCYSVSLPNHKLENNIYNSSLCSFSTANDVGIKENKLSSNEIKISPNPTNSRLFIESSSAISNFIITDISGRIMMQGIGTKEIFVSDLNSGLYFISLISKENTIIKKFIKE